MPEGASNSASIRFCAAPRACCAASGDRARAATNAINSASLARPSTSRADSGLPLIPNGSLERRSEAVSALSSGCAR